MSDSPNTAAVLPSLRKSMAASATPGQRPRDGASILALSGSNNNRVSVVGSYKAGSKLISGSSGTLRKSRSSTTAELPAEMSRRSVGMSDEALLTSLVTTDLAATKVATDTYYNQYKEAEAENAKLRAALRQQEVDSVQVVQFLESKLREVEIETQAYKTGITQLLDDHHHAEEELQSKYGEMLRERDIELTRYASVTTRLHDDLRQASRYVQQRQEHTLELQHLQTQLEDLVVEHEKEVAALHFQTVDRKLKLIALEKTMRAEFDALVEARAAKALEERFQRVLERTRRLEEEKVSMTHDIHDLMQLTTDIDAERTQVQRQAAVQQQAHKELVHQAMARGRQKEQADLKIYELEERVRELTAQLQVVRVELQASYQSRIDVLQTELKSTRTSLQTHRAELLHMRQLTARVVGERSELENFFHTALADCQRYRHAMSANCHASTAASATGASKGAMLLENVDWGGSASRGGAPRQTPQESVMTVAAAASPAPSSSSLAATLKNSGVFFEEMPWKDKEKVIKALLFFLNANYYKSLSPAPTAAGSGPLDHVCAS
ncbi:hypothetical protein LPMP_241620 [Leishmania panamensis]|uniref:Basal body-orientation factor 1 n=2 Tax=Leishmania guyanensis species complex TaxID=38579 RepID=A0A088RU61_LEIPA|nr:hypothetical protein LPMP_241620 [Leishmania panamensis]AIN98794.1 hypothetical protein LPMP_241620 [Leishmania panamensis]